MPLGALAAGQKWAVRGSTTSDPSRILRAAAASAHRTVRRHDCGRRKPIAAHPPSRSRKEISPRTQRIGTSLGILWYTLWPITMALPARNSSRERQRFAGASLAGMLKSAVAGDAFASACMFIRRILGSLSLVALDAR